MPDFYHWGEKFQTKILALLISKPDKVGHFIEPQYFTSPVMVDIARLVKMVYDRHGKKDVRISRPTLLEVVKGSLSDKKMDLWPAYKQAIIKSYQQKLQDSALIETQAFEFAKERKYRTTLVSAENDINNRRYDLALKKFTELKTFGKDKDLGLNYWEGVNPGRWEDDRSNLVRTWYLPTLDAAMGGGLGAGEEGIIMAGGKVGKSLMLARISAGAMWQKKKVAIATGEISAKKYRRRIDAMLTGIPIGKLQLRDDAEERMRQLRGHIKGELWIKQFPTSKADSSDIENWIEDLKDEGYKPDLLVVDYLRVFNSAEKFQDRKENIGQLAAELRGIAVEEQIPVWTATQVNRAALSKSRLGPQDLAEDISLFWTTDFLLALCQTDDEELKNRARMVLVAARDVGGGSVVDVKIIRKRMIIREMTKLEKAA